VQTSDKRQMHDYLFMSFKNLLNLLKLAALLLTSQITGISQFENFHLLINILQIIYIPYFCLSSCIPASTDPALQ